MSVQGEFTKRPADAFVAAINMRPWPIAEGDILVDSNARGNLDLLIEDEAGADVTSTLSGGEVPWIIGPGQDQVAFWLTGGAVGRYKIVVTGPTQSGELLTGVAYLSIVP